MKINIKKDKTGGKYVEVDVDGYGLIANPILNKGRSFSDEERESLGLRGLVPPGTVTLDEVVNKDYNVLKLKVDDLGRHIYLRAIQNRNETLFYALLNRHIEEMLPLIYTPTVGQACQQFSQIYQRPRGIFITYNDRDHIDEILEHSCFDDTEVIVVSDGERILGLGDLGACGMGIPIGKLSIYTACAGIPPYKTLPILLDAGTDNESLLRDTLYLGWRNKRIRGKEYDEFVEKFIQAIKKRFPNVLLQWEDFARSNALKLLNRYKDQLCSFNDDIQGTASIVVGALLSATNVAGIPLSQQKIVIVGAGSAGVGISNLIVDAVIDLGTERKIAIENLFLVDRCGLLTDKVECLDFQAPFIKPLASLCEWKIADNSNISLLETVTNAKATMIIGVCTQPGIFTREIIEQLATNCERPIVFPLSNPTTKAEAHPHDVLAWTKGKAIVGTGSPVPPYIMDDNNQRLIDQVNNCYIFPGIGLGIRAVNGKRITNKMFLIAAKALADISPAKNNPQANLLPPCKEIRKVSRHIALAIAKEVVREGLTDMKSLDETKIIDLIDKYMWEPVYLPYFKKVNKT
ncbi:NAD-dependent malic enzyme 2 [Gammaproteobacteria bacterium]